SASVRIVDGEELVTELVVEGEGSWTVDAETGAISFAPEDGFSGNPTPVTYQVADESGETARAEVRVTYVPAAADDESLDNAPGASVTVPVLGNDLGELDPASVRIVDGEELVTELVVPGEGTWTVDPVTGAIIFVPEDGFTGNPTPITYQVSDTEGNDTRATVTITYRVVDEPEQPGEPSEPGEPGDPGDPGAPSQPSDPGAPGEPGAPSDPSDPGDLSNTGGESMVLAGAAALLLALMGAAVYFFGRRRKDARS
ncbi:LPXTG cell wall anchor domain-containing protein, partial [Leucobacter sp. USCH14]|uniref:Ig-like domain-containing protein n=1 Tax=Leucobacter sp. USCH14 TaxID=3024838 RepID=UPI0030AE8B77